MAAATQTSIPLEIRAGDTVRWRRQLPDYPASEGWELKYAIVGQGGVFSLTASADGDEYAIEATAAATATWAAGRYSIQESVTRTTERFTTDVRNLRVLANLAASSGNPDLRTHARKVLDAIEAWLENKAPVAGSIEIGDRKISHYPLTELLALRDRYRAEVTREEAGAGGKAVGRLLTRI